MSALAGKPLIGWQTLLADLSLILFMVTAAAMASAPPPPRHPTPVRAVPAPAVARAEPLALWRPAPGGPGLGAWLASQQPDPRQQLTVAAHYAPGEAAAALAAVHRALAGAGPAGGRARIVIEADAPPGTAPALAASLAYDRAPLATGA